MIKTERRVLSITNRTEQIAIVVAYLAAIIGLLDSLYLTYVKLDTSTPAFCAPGGGCDVVNSSVYADFMGIPIALLGAGMYLVLIGLLWLENRGGFWKQYGLMAMLGISLAGVLYSAYLTYIEIAVLHAICPYCVISAITISIFFLVTVFRLVKYQPYDD
jgi:uncharacterized membrane protein